MPKMNDNPYTPPVVTLTGTGELEALAQKRDVFKPVEIHVWPGVDQYLAIKALTYGLTLFNGDKIQLAEWYFLRASPDQLRALADAVEARQGPGWEDRLHPEARALLEQRRKEGFPG